MNHAALIDQWQALRAELRAVEATEHPDIVDGYGRAWQWKSRDLYSHDETIATPAHLIPTFGLPLAGLAERNPNYTRLCAVCRHEPAS